MVAFTSCGHCFCEKDFQRIIDEASESTKMSHAPRVRRIVRAFRPPVNSGGQTIPHNAGQSVHPSFGSSMRPAQASFPPYFPRGASGPSIPFPGNEFPHFGTSAIPMTAHQAPTPPTSAPPPAIPSQANVPMFMAMAATIPSSRASPPPALSTYQRSGVVPTESSRQRMAEPKRRKLLHVQGFSTGSGESSSSVPRIKKKASGHDSLGNRERRKRGRASNYGMNKAPWSP